MACGQGNPALFSLNTQDMSIWPQTLLHFIELVLMLKD